MLTEVTAPRYVTPLRECGSLPGIVEADDPGLPRTRRHPLLLQTTPPAHRIGHGLKKDHPARDVYEALKGGTDEGLCPLCAHRDAETLDYQLPKSKYPLLSVVPVNLVPACHRCNANKSDADLKTASEQTLHPYFDDLGAE
ncbi:hypothetical protein [Streptomyces sp. NPDC053720]|uniref:hypothetical protein n=1 Tax=Streptomyces sp. NPDC053720 TaxID=3154855 RepID=UPI00344753A5